MKCTGHRSVEIIIITISGGKFLQVTELLSQELYALSILINTVKLPSQEITQIYTPTYRV